jgi:acetyl coenzyme A synthetase (ADP forming)-like protein
VGTAAEGVDIVLRDGSTGNVRPVRADDLGAVRAFLAALSEESLSLRFFSAGVSVDRAAQAALDPGGGASLVAVTGADGRVVGHGTYVPVVRGRAEVAFAVADDWQAHGIGTILLAHLADAAAAAGIHTFTASVLPRNHRMIGVLRDSGYPVELRSGVDEIVVSLPTSLTDEGRRRFEERERTAARAAAAHVLRPASIAVVGASRRRDTVGGKLLHNLLSGGYGGALYAVTPRAHEVQGLPAFASVADLPEPVDLAVIAVPAPAVVDVAKACATRAVRALVVLSAGFAEVGEPGARRQRELLTVCRSAGMRLLGPNCLGVLNTDIGLNATFAPGTPPAGRVAFASQSRALGIAALALAAERSIGLSSFVSLGDRADLSSNDFLQYWETDERTEAVLLYLESFGNPRNFGQVARRMAAAKPVIAVKSGRTRAGQRAMSSHTGAIVAASDTTVDALFAHAGVIRTETIGELFDVAAVLSRQPLPPGDRVAIVTNGGGPAILCADACAASRLRVEPLSQAIRHRLAAALPPEASVANPVDMSVAASAADYKRTLRAVLADATVDAVIAIFVTPLATRAADVARAIEAVSRARAAGEKTMLAVFMGPDRPTGAASEPTGVPAFASPEEAARALGHAVRHARRHAAEPDPPPDLAGIDADRSASIVATALGADGGWLTPTQVEALLQCWAVPTTPSRLATSPRSAGRAAAALGGAVALKAVAPGLVHKSEIGAVRLGLTGATLVERAAKEVAAVVQAQGHRLDGYLVQTMATGGVELLVGVVGDPAFGPLVAVGAGGTAAELIRDVQMRLAPLGRREAAAMLRELRTFPLLDGYRGRPAVDIAAIEDVLLRISSLAAAHPEIAELDCNPVIAGEEGSVVVDARIRVAPPPPPHHYGALDR